MTTSEVNLLHLIWRKLNLIHFQSRSTKSFHKNHFKKTFLNLKIMKNVKVNWSIKFANHCCVKLRWNLLYQFIWIMQKHLYAKNNEKRESKRRENNEKLETLQNCPIEKFCKFAVLDSSRGWQDDISSWEIAALKYFIKPEIWSCLVSSHLPTPRKSRSRWRCGRRGWVLRGPGEAGRILWRLPGCSWCSPCTRPCRHSPPRPRSPPPTAASGGPPPPCRTEGCEETFLLKQEVSAPGDCGGDCGYPAASCSPSSSRGLQSDSLTSPCRERSRPPLPTSVWRSVWSGCWTARTSPAGAAQTEAQCDHWG